MSSAIAFHGSTGVGNQQLMIRVGGSRRGRTRIKLCEERAAGGANAKVIRVLFAAARMDVLTPIQNHKKDDDEICSSSQHLCFPRSPDLENERTPELQFNRLQHSEQELDSRLRRMFGRFVAREAILDEEYWTAAWLRAESRYEGQSEMRHVDNFKKKFAEQEFNSLKNRCFGPNAQNCTCIVAVKQQDGTTKRTVLNSVVGTLDVSIRHLLQGEDFPRDPLRNFVNRGFYRNNTSRYGYIANVCVAKFARRQGIASNMLFLAMEAAKEGGVSQVFIHVDRSNTAAQTLYEKIGFKIVNTALPGISGEQRYLMCSEV